MAQGLSKSQAEWLGVTTKLVDVTSECEIGWFGENAFAQGSTHEAMNGYMWIVDETGRNICFDAPEYEIKLVGDAIKVFKRVKA